MAKTFEEAAYAFHALVNDFCQENPGFCVAATLVTPEQNATVMNLSPEVMNKDNWCIHRAIVELCGDYSEALHEQEQRTRDHVIGGKKDTVQ